MSLYTIKNKGKDTIDERRKENAERDDDKKRSYRVSDMIYVIFKLYHLRNDAMSFVDNALLADTYLCILHVIFYIILFSFDI